MVELLCISHQYTWKGQDIQTQKMQGCLCLINESTYYTHDVKHNPSWFQSNTTSSCSEFRDWSLQCRQSLVGRCQQQPLPYWLMISQVNSQNGTERGTELERAGHCAQELAFLPSNSLGRQKKKKKLYIGSYRRTPLLPEVGASINFKKNKTTVLIMFPLSSTRHGVISLACGFVSHGW